MKEGWEGEGVRLTLTVQFSFSLSLFHAAKVVGDLFHDLLALALVSGGFVFYLTFGASGGPAWGKPTNHFFAHGPLKSKLFPGKWKNKVLVSALGVLAMLALLAYCCNATSFWRVAAVYGGPYLGLNAWLGIVTKLHHTDVDVPHLEGEEWNWVRGAFLTIDRPYYKIVDVLQVRRMRKTGVGGCWRGKNADLRFLFC